MNLHLSKIPTGARTEERCVRVFGLFQENADGLKQKKKTTIDENVEEGTSGQKFAINRAGWMKDNNDFESPSFKDPHRSENRGEVRTSP